MKNSFVYQLIFLLLAGCASNIPVEIREDLPGNTNVTIDAVRNNINQYTGQRIRWGGTIASVENKVNDTWIEIVARELNAWGRPAVSDNTQGRFLARIDGFLDPEIYKEGRRVTIYGTIESRSVRQLDTHPYTYPVIKAESYYLWKEYPRRYYAYYDPFYGFYPYRYSFYYRYHFGHFHYPYYWYGYYGYPYWYW